MIKDAIFDNNVLGFHVEYIKTVEGNYDFNDKQLVEGIDIDKVMGSDERMTMICKSYCCKSQIKNEKSTVHSTFYSVEYSCFDEVLRYLQEH